MRWIRKLVILSLAAFGAYRLYELATAKADQVRTDVGPPVGNAIETVKTTAAHVKEDLADGKSDIADGLHAALSPEPEPRMAVNADRIDLTEHSDPAVDPA
jgi:hypothetical protein